MIRLTLRQMQYFEALAGALHFGRAAAIAGVSQPALSAQIAELERALGCRLFERGGKDVRMTEEARLLKPRIEQILADTREVEALAERGPASMGGRFRLGIIPTVAPYLLPQILPALRLRFPALALELRESVTASLVEETGAGRLDAMVAALPIEAAGLTSQELFSDVFLLCVPASDPVGPPPPIPPDSILPERLMLLEEGHCMRDQALSACNGARPSDVSDYAATSLTTLMQMVAHGLGTTLIPQIARAAAEAMPGLRVVPLAEPALARRIALFWRKASSRGAECRALAEVIREVKAIDQSGSSN